jgi:hypothetical protein
LEAHGLMGGGKAFIGLSYIVLSVILCIGAIAAANALVK